MIRSTDDLRRIMRQPEGKDELQCPTCARIATVSPWKTTSDGSLGEREQQGKVWCAICRDEYDLRQPNRLPVVLTG